MLNDYDIGCGPCNVGICLLKDIVAIHRLSDEQEQQLMARIAKAIHSDRDIRLPRVEKKTEAKPKVFKYSPPMKKLVDEDSDILKVMHEDHTRGRNLVKEMLAAVDLS